MSPRVSVWLNGERITCDRATLWAAVERVGDPMDSPEAFEAFRRELARRSDE